MAPFHGGRQDVDWTCLEERLRTFELEGLAYSIHREHPFLPPELAERLRPVHLATALHSSLTVDAGRRAVGALGRAGTPVVLLKGAALIEADVYPDPGARGLGDVDLLVRPEDASDAVRVLIDSGFQPWSPWSPDRVAWLDSVTLADEEAPGGAEIHVDLHWRLGYAGLRSGRPQSEDALWVGADHRSALPSAEPHIVVILEHVLKHFHVLYHVVGMADSARLLERVTDPAAFGRLVDASPLRRGIRLLLEVLRSEFGRTVPGHGEVRRPRALRLVSVGRLVEERSGRGRLEGLFTRWIVLGSLRAALEDTMRTLVPGRAWLRAKYGSPDRGRWALLVRYWMDVVRWTRGGVSPVSPNQEWE